MNVSMFSEFVKENISKILAIPHPKYPLNKDNVYKWVRRHSETWRDTAGVVSNLFENISWDEFLGQMNRVVNDLGIYRDKDVYLYVPFNHHRKSNFFATVLFFYIFCHKQGHSFKGIYKLYSSDIPKGSIVVVVDDAAYSGRQLYETAIRNITFKEIRIFLAVPYMSKTTQNWFSSKRNVIIPPSVKTFHNLQTYFGDSKDTSDDCDFKFCDEICARHGLYFDFKLPDNISVFEESLAYGTTLEEFQTAYFDNGNGGRHSAPKTEPVYIGTDALCLIDGCKDTYGDEALMGYYSGGFNKMCPVSFYKDIYWTFRGDAPVWRSLL